MESTGKTLKALKSVRNLDARLRLHQRVKLEWGKIKRKKQKKKRRFGLKFILLIGWIKHSDMQRYGTSIGISTNVAADIGLILACWDWYFSSSLTLCFNWILSSSSSSAFVNKTASSVFSWYRIDTKYCSVSSVLRYQGWKSVSMSSWTYATFNQKEFWAKSVVLSATLEQLRTPSHACPSFFALHLLAQIE